MKPAADKPTPPDKRAPRIAGASQKPPGDASPDEAESLGEQTLVFGAIRFDDDGDGTAPGQVASSPPPRAGAKRADGLPAPAPDDPLAAFRAAAAAAEATIASLTGAAGSSHGGEGSGSSSSGPAGGSRGDGDAAPEGTAIPSRSGARSPGGASPPSSGGVPGSAGAGGVSGPSSPTGRSSSGPAVPEGLSGGSAPARDDAFAAFRAAAAAAEATIASLTGAASTSRAGEGNGPPPGGVPGSAGAGGVSGPSSPAGRSSSGPAVPEGLSGGSAPAPAPAPDDAFAAFRAAAAAAEATIASLTGGVAVSGEEANVTHGGDHAPGSPVSSNGVADASPVDRGAPTPFAEKAPASLAETPEEEPGASLPGAGANANANPVATAGPGDAVLESDSSPRPGAGPGPEVEADPDPGFEGDDHVDEADRHGSHENEETEDGRGDRVRETLLPDAVSEALTNALTILRTSVTDLRFGLDLPGAEEARRTQSEILAQLDDYVIPRVHTSTAPALVVVAGSTGAGKSTLLNTLANAKVSATGVRRPTTGTPVLACHPDDHGWFAGGELLGSLRRQDAPDPEAAPGGLILVSTERLPSGVALLDTPDIDSVVEEHHEIAHRMLDAADLWIFVTTAARYADAPAWRLLRLAKERGARLAIVLSRVPPRSREVVTKHFFRMLTEYGLGGVDRFVIDESKVTDGMLPEHEVAELRLWLTELSIDDQRRMQAVQATLSGVLNSFRTRIPALARQLEAQVVFRKELRGDVDTAYAGALAEIEEATRNGSLLRGEVLARWQDFAGSGDLMRTLHLRRPGRFAGKASHQAPERLSALKSALRAAVESVVISAAQRAGEEAVARWLQRPGAGAALAAAPGLGGASDDLLRKTGRTVAAWQEHIIELIRTEGVTKRAVARLVSFDVESLALIFAVGLLGDGSTGTEGVVTGTLPRRLVHALLGAESLRTIGSRARSDLRARIGMLFDDEMARYVQVLDGAGIPDESAATRLHRATYNLEVAR